ncbi:MAG: phosphodiester glycosidase family protein [Candidatus Gracilibacteria bacterium]|nr:phosphodiester glycosidase family protein [Candidatus Gracilibacteria bacterium]
MRKILFGIILFLIINQVSAYEYSRKTYTTSLGDYQIRLFKLDLAGDDRLVVGVSDKGESLESLVKRYNGKAGLNGTYFCPEYYPECKGKNFSNADRISYGEDFSRWTDTGERYVFAIDKDYMSFFFNTSNYNVDMRNDIYMGIGNHPLILLEGQNKLEHYYDVGLIDKKMPSTGAKTFICTVKDTKKVYMGIVYSARMDDLPTILSDIGCYNALNLDAGRSTALYNNGEYYVGPGREIMDALIITDKANDEKNKKIVDMARKSKLELMNKINALTQDKAQRQNIIQKLVDKIDLLSDKTNGVKKTLLILVKNNLMKEIGENLAFR